MSVARFCGSYLSNRITAAMAGAALAVVALLAPSATAQESATDDSASVDAEATARRQEVQVLRRGMQRLVRSVESPSAETASAARAHDSDRNWRYAKTYPAADLAFSLRKVVSVEIDNSGKAIAHAAKAEDGLNELEELIMSRVDPPSWVAAGGDAMIKRYTENLSFVITQTEVNHQCIADLIGDLRRGRGRKVVLETKVITGTRASFLNKIANLGVPVPGSRKPQSLSGHQTKLLLDAAQKDHNATLVDVPALTLAPGQLAQLRLADGSSDRANVLIRADADAAHSQVHLTIVANAPDAVDALRFATSITLRLGEPALLDITERRVESTDHVPLADQLKASDFGGGDHGAKTLLVITPRIAYDPPAYLGVASTP